MRRPFRAALAGFRAAVADAGALACARVNAIFREERPMPRDLFNTGTTSTALTRAFTSYTVLCSAALHLVIIAVALMVPLLADDVLPKPEGPRVQFVTTSFRPPNPPAPPAALRPVQVVNRNAAPIVQPTSIRDPEPMPPTDVAPGGLSVEGAQPSALGAGPNIGEALRNAAPTPPPPAPVHAPTKPVPIGGLIREPIKTHHVPPIYPQIAQSARIEGDVVIQAVIGTDGVVQEARVISGRPLLNEAALDAVRQWRYTPTTLNNQPVAVIMTVTVAFRLQH
jgi:protein TonB